jgi:threonine/homoserine/homoserine lactone efflux protein
MLSIEPLSSFFIISLFLAIAPGPDNIFVLTQSALRGRLAGLMVTLGLCTGLLAHTAAVTLGVAAVFQASATAFIALKLVGAAYLLYLAWQAFRTASSTLKMGKDSGLSAWQLYRRGIIMNITNPKVSIFFLAFLPQFSDPKLGPISTQMISLGAVFMLATLLMFGCIALLAGSLGHWLQHSQKSQRLMHRVAGTVFAMLAIKLVTTTR